MFKNNQVKHKMNPFQLPNLQTMNEGVVFNNNARGLQVTLRQGRRKGIGFVTDYENGQLLVPFGGRLGTHRLDLNNKLKGGELSINVAPHVLVHARALLQSRSQIAGKRRSGCPQKASVAVARKGLA